MYWSSFLLTLITSALASGFVFLHLEIGGLVLAPAAAWFAFLTFALNEAEEQKYVLTLGGIRWSEADFCRGWEIDGRTGSGKTASGVVPIIHALKANRPNMGILALDTKGDLSEPLWSVAEELGRESDIRQLEVRPDNAPPDWQPAYTINILADRSIPHSTYAKLLVDVATAAGQKGGQAFFKNAAQVAIQNAMALLDALDWAVTIDNCYHLVTDMAELEKRVKELDLGRLVTIKIPQKFQTEKKYISLLLKVLFYLHALRRYDLPAREATHSEGRQIVIEGLSMLYGEKLYLL